MKASGHLRIRWVISALLLVFPMAASSARAQDDDIRAAVTETLAAWGAGDFDTFGAFYHPEARGFFFDGGPMITVSTWLLSKLRMRRDCGPASS